MPIANWIILLLMLAMLATGLCYFYPDLVLIVVPIALAWFYSYCFSWPREIYAWWGRGWRITALIVGAFLTHYILKRVATTAFHWSWPTGMTERVWQSDEATAPVSYPTKLALALCALTIPAADVIRRLINRAIDWFNGLVNPNHEWRYVKGGGRYGPAINKEIYGESTHAINVVLSALCYIVPPILVTIFVHKLATDAEFVSYFDAPTIIGRPPSLFQVGLGTLVFTLSYVLTLSFLLDSMDGWKIEFDNKRIGTWAPLFAGSFICIWVKAMTLIGHFIGIGC